MNPKTRTAAIIIIFLSCLLVIKSVFSAPTPPAPPPTLYFFSSSFNRHQTNRVIKFFSLYFGQEIHLSPVYLFSKVAISNPPSKDTLAFNNGLYTAQNGRDEANQNIRELCALKIAKNHQQWWQFLDRFDSNCHQQNPDVCWTIAAAKTGLDPNLITDCFNHQAQSLIESQLAAISSFGQVKNGDVFINHTPITNFQVDLFKSAICQSFSRPPKVCYLPTFNP